MTTSITRNNLFQRQLSLLGEKAQAQLEAARVLVIGVGGLGCPALQYLAAAGLGKIGLVDFDVVSVSNLQRQILFRATDIGRPKVEVARERLQELAPFCNIHTYQQMLNSQSAATLIADYDIVLDCTDNFSSKFLIHDTCLQLKKVLIQAAVYQYEGQILHFDFRHTSGPCLRCLWPVEPLDGCTGTCAEVGVLGPLLGVMGSMQAAEAIKLIIGKEHLQSGEVLFMDLSSLALDIRKFKQQPECPCCVQKKHLSAPTLQIPLPTDLSEFVIIDVRSQEEISSCHFVKSLLATQQILHVPLERIEEFSPDRTQKYLTICAKGIRSLKACRALRTKHDNIYSLIGGVDG